MTARGLLLIGAMLALSVIPARAEIVFFNNGRNLSIESHHLEGDEMVMDMRGGGEMTLDASLIAHIDPDEVPYPEPAPVAAAPTHHRSRHRRRTYASKRILVSIR